MLRRGNIWCLNAGENYKVKLATWWEFVKEIESTNVTVSHQPASQNMIIYHLFFFGWGALVQENTLISGDGRLPLHDEKPPVGSICLLWVSVDFGTVAVGDLRLIPADVIFWLGTPSSALPFIQSLNVLFSLPALPFRAPIRVQHAYLSEHVITADLKKAMRKAIRDNRVKHTRHKTASNFEVIRRCTNMW